MPLIRTSQADSFSRIDPQQQEWLYCGLDAAVTLELDEVFQARIEKDPFADLNYRANLALQAPAMTMQLRGLRVDETARKRLLQTLMAEGETKQAEVNKLALALLPLGSEPPFRYNKALPPSPHQLAKFFFDTLGIAPVKTRDGARTTAKDALTRIAKREPRTRPLCEAIQSLRDLEKQIEVLSVARSPDGRLRSMFNVGQAETDRWSSNSDPYKKGTNLQNIDSRLRGIFIPDPGFVFLEVDLEQGESRCVAYLAGDPDYIKAHEDGNTHVVCSRKWWPGLRIPADDRKAKEFLKGKQVPWVIQAGGGEASKSYYDVSKNRQHGFNYGRTARSVAIMEGIKVAEGQKALDIHFDAYPGIPRWHEREKEMLRRTGVQITPLGYRRQFFGPPKDEHTIKEALANGPQSMSVQILNTGLWRCWRDLDGPDFQLLQQGHDSFLAQVRLGKEAWAKAEVEKRMAVPVDVNGLTMTIPCKVAFGPNWGEMR